MNEAIWGWGAAVGREFKGAHGNTVERPELVTEWLSDIGRIPGITIQAFASRDEYLTWLRLLEE